MRPFLALTLAFFALSASAKNIFVYFGTYTNALSRGIYVSRLDPDSGILSPPELAAETPNPCFLAVSPDEKYLYAANSVNTFSDDAVKKGGAVSAFAIGPDGRLTPLNQQGSGGLGPCYVSVDATGKILFVANYGDGSVKAFLLATNGFIGAGGDRVARAGHSVNPNRQSSAHAHFIRADPSNRFALVCDLGTDEVISYPFDPNTAKLFAASLETGSVPPGAGARHLTFSRDGKFTYVLNEMGCSITRFELDENGRLHPRETISMLPPEVALQPSFTAAEIRVHPSGKFIYATIRGHDSVSVFAVDEKSGRLTLLQNISSGGQVPRGLGLDPTGNWLIVGNQKSDRAVEFAIDPHTGKLQPSGKELTIGSPVDVSFVIIK